MYMHVWTMYIHVYTFHCTYYVRTVYRRVYTFSELFKHVHTCLYISRNVHTCLNRVRTIALSKGVTYMVQTCLYTFMPGGQGSRCRASGCTVQGGHCTRWYKVVQDGQGIRWYKQRLSRYIRESFKSYRPVRTGMYWSLRFNLGMLPCQSCVQQINGFAELS